MTAPLLHCVFGGNQYNRGMQETNISQDSLELSRSNIVVENGFYVDDSFEGEEKYITTPSILLDRGIYKVIINYDTKYGMSSVKAEIPGGGV